MELELNTAGTGLRSCTGQVVLFKNYTTIKTILHFKVRQVGNVEIIKTHQSDIFTNEELSWGSQQSVVCE